MTLQDGGTFIAPLDTVYKKEKSTMSDLIPHTEGKEHQLIVLTSLQPLGPQTCIMCSKKNDELSKDSSGSAEKETMTLFHHTTLAYMGSWQIKMILDATHENSKMIESDILKYNYSEVLLGNGKKHPTSSIFNR